MNTDSVDCTRCPYPTPHDAVSKPGDFCWGTETEADGRILYIHLPGCTNKDATAKTRAHECAHAGFAYALRGVMSKDPLKIDDWVNYENKVVGCAYCGAVMPRARCRARAGFHGQR